jgi:hypothetical protein
VFVIANYAARRSGPANAHRIAEQISGTNPNPTNAGV